MKTSPSHLKTTCIERFRTFNSMLQTHKTNRQPTHETCVINLHSNEFCINYLNHGPHTKCHTFVQFTKALNIHIDQEQEHNTTHILNVIHKSEHIQAGPMENELFILSLCCSMSGSFWSGIYLCLSICSVTHGNLPVGKRKCITYFLHVVQ